MKYSRIALSLVLILTLFLATCVACSSTTDVPTTTPLWNADDLSNQPNTSGISLTKAIQLFKKNPDAEVEGWEFDDYDQISNGNERFSIHTATLESASSEVAIIENQAGLTTMDDGIFTRFEYGSVTKSLSIPEDFVYCGYTERQICIGSNCSDGFVIRYGDLVKFITSDLSEVITIATDVKYVVELDYRYNSNFYGILFLMEDNSLKCYLNDESGNLYDVRYEGGYDSSHFTMTNS